MRFDKKNKTHLLITNLENTRTSPLRNMNRLASGCWLTGEVIVALCYLLNNVCHF